MRLDLVLSEFLYPGVAGVIVQERSKSWEPLREGHEEKQ